MTQVTVVTFSHPAPTRRCPIKVGDLSWSEYCKEIVERYRRPGSFSSAGDTRRWRKECRKYGWKYKSAQVFDDAIVIWEHSWNTYRPGLTRKVSQILERG